MLLAILAGIALAIGLGIGCMNLVDDRAHGTHQTESKTGHIRGE